MQTKNLLILTVLVFFSAGAMADTHTLIKVLKDKRRFTIKKDSSFQEGTILTLRHLHHPSRVGRATITECKEKSCIAELSEKSLSFPLDENISISTPKGKRKYAIALSTDNAIGLTYGVAGYYNFPNRPWMAGVKFRNIDNTISNIKLSGQILSVEAQRHLWNTFRFQFWATSELGIMNIKMDLSKVNANEAPIKEREYFMSLGLEGRINMTERLRLIAGGGVIANTMKSSYKGENETYALSGETLYGTVKVGLIYFF